MKLADKIKSKYPHQNYCDDVYDEVWAESVEHSILCLYDADPAFRPYVDTNRHEAIFYLTDGSWIFFNKEDKDIYTCTHLEEQGLELKFIELDDRAPSVIIVDRLQNQTTTEQQMNWIMNPDYTGKPISIDWTALASTLKITLAELNQYWNNGSICVFNGLDAICDHYRESGLDGPAVDLLKEEIREGSVIYTQHLFFMWL